MSACMCRWLAVAAGVGAVEAACRDQVVVLVLLLVLALVFLRGAAQGGM